MKNYTKQSQVIGFGEQRLELTMRFIVGLLMLAIGTGQAWAQQPSVDINDLRAEFAESNQAARSGPEMLPDNSDDSSLSAPVTANTETLSKTEADLKAQEAEILRQLATKSGRGFKSVILVKGDEKPTTRSIPTGVGADFGAPDSEAEKMPIKEKSLSRAGIDRINGAGSLASEPNWTDAAPASGPAQDDASLLKGKYSALESQNSAQKKTISGLKETNESLAHKVQSADQRYAELKQRYDETQNRLMVAETEIERLSSMLDARNKSNLSRLLGDREKKIAESALPIAAKASLASRAVDVTAGPTDSPSDVSIATVIADKVNLRTGPGKDNSPLMAVSKGTRLVVETRSGSWLRVVAPTGTRAWISSDVVDFGPGGTTSGGERTVRIRGYDDSVETLAKQHISNSSAHP